MPSQQQFQQNMEVMSGHDHSEGYDYHSVKEALDDFLTKACSDPGDTELDKIMHGMSFLSGVLSAYKLICPGHPNVDDAEELISSTSARLKEAGKEVSGSTAAGKRRLN